jgi:hypothetical protein
MLTPLDRVRRDLAERGVPLAMGTLVKLVERAADLLDGVDGHHWQQLQKGPWIATDSTGIKVLIPALPHAHDGYLEQYRNNDAVVFQYEATKDGEIAERKFKNFKGTVTADAEHRFNGVFNDDVKEAGCNAHARRKFEAAEAAQPALAVEGGRFIGAMYGEEDKAKGLVGAALVAHRQQHTRPIADEFLKWLLLLGDNYISPSATTTSPHPLRREAAGGRGPRQERGRRHAPGQRRASEDADGRDEQTRPGRPCSNEGRHGSQDGAQVRGGGPGAVVDDEGEDVADAGKPLRRRLA